MRKSVDKNGDERLDENTRHTIHCSTIHSKSSNTIVETVNDDTVKRILCAGQNAREENDEAKHNVFRQSMRIGNDSIYHGNNSRIYILIYRSV